MHALTIARITAGLALAASLGAEAWAQVESEAPAMLKPGDYDCTTRNGRVLDGRGFTILDGRHYTKGGSSGVYEIQGDRVYFDLGDLDGKQIRILSTGRIKFSSDIFCIYAGGLEEMIPETPQPDEAAPPAEGAAPADGAAPVQGTAPADGTSPAEPPPAEPPPAPAPPAPPKLIKVDPNQPAAADPRLTTAQP